MDNTNIKLLALYYSLQKKLEKGLAAPMINLVKPIISLSKDDYKTVAMKTLPFLKGNIKLEDLEKYIENTFVAIDSGEMAADRYLGSKLDSSKIIDQLQVHDVFMCIFNNFFEQIEAQKAESLDTIRSSVLSEIADMGLVRNEVQLFRALFSKNKAQSRSPITVELAQLQEIIDSMHEATCQQCGPAFADQLLSFSVKEAGEKVPKFDATVFI